MTPNDTIRWWARRLVAIERKVAAVEAGELTLPRQGDKLALYDAYKGVTGLLRELRAGRP